MASKQADHLRDLTDLANEVRSLRTQMFGLIQMIQEEA